MQRHDQACSGASGQKKKISWLHFLISMCGDCRSVCVCVCVSGAAGCVATLLHDAAMNPAEGKGKMVPSHRLELLILPSKQQF